MCRSKEDHDSIMAHPTAPMELLACVCAALLETVIFINKHLHPCILLCEPGRVLRQAVRLKTRAPALRAGPLFYIDPRFL